jgi:competence protein ComEC
MPLFWLSLAFMTGVLLGESVPWSWRLWSLLGGICMAFLLARGWYQDRLQSIIPPPWIEVKNRLSLDVPLCLPPFALILVCLSLGGLRYQLAQPDFDDPSFIAFHNDSGVEKAVQGVLARPPDEYDGYTNLVIGVDQIHTAGDTDLRSVHGLLLARGTSGEKFQYGDRVVARGVLQTPSEDGAFSHKGYLAHQGIYSVMFAREVSVIARASGGSSVLRSIYSLRDGAHQVVYKMWPDPEASLLAGILLGIESKIPETVGEAFKETATSHIVAISGFNITIVAGLFIVLFNRMLGRWRGGLVAILGIGVYTLLVGADAAVVRAAIMGALTVFARQLGRQQTGMNSLAIVAALMAVFDPHVLWTASFQLSFMATLGLVLYADPMSQGFLNWASQRLPLTTEQRLAGPVGEYLLFTLAAQLTSLPITMWLSRQLSISSLLANPLILPAQPAVMVLGGLATIAGLIYLPLGQLMAYVAWPFVVYTIRMVEFIADHFEGALRLGRVSLLVVLLYYLLLFGWTFIDPLIQRLLAALRGSGATDNGRNWQRALMGLLLLFPAVANVIVWREAFNLPDARLHMTVLDVSHGSHLGDGVLIQSPTGRYVLINGGPSSTRLSDQLGRQLPPLHRRIDFLVVAAPSKEQLAALPDAIEGFSLQSVLWAGPTAADANARRLRGKLSAAGVPIVAAQTGHALDLGAGARLHVLSAGKRGAIFCLEWGDFRALLPIGANFDDLESLQYGRSIGRVSALLLAEHGYAPVNAPEWISNLRPQVILLSVSGGNSEDLPSPETVQLVQGFNLLRTDRNGWIRLSTDGEDLWVEVQKR